MNLLPSSDDIDKLILELNPRTNSILVKTYKGDAVESFRVSEASLGSIFVDRYTTGFLPVSEDGVIYLEERNKNQLVIVQRRARENASLRWGAFDRYNDYSTVTHEGIFIPYLFGFYMLQPSGSQFRILKERIYCSSGALLGRSTPIFSTSWMGNVYQGPSTSHSNICWGSASIRPPLVSVGSLPNFLNDFILQPFNNDLGGSLDRWKRFSTTKDFLRIAGQSWTIEEQIRRMWENADC